MKRGVLEGQRLAGPSLAFLTYGRSTLLRSSKVANRSRNRSRSYESISWVTERTGTQASEVLCRLWDNIGSKLQQKTDISAVFHCEGTQEVTVHGGTHSHFDTSDWAASGCDVEKYNWVRHAEKLRKIDKGSNKLLCCCGKGKIPRAALTIYLGQIPMPRACHACSGHRLGF